MILVAFIVGVACGAVSIIGGLVYVWSRAGSSKQSPPSPRKALQPYAQLNAEGKLERLKHADAVLGFAIGDEPIFGAKCWRRENAR